MKLDDANKAKELLEKVENVRGAIREINGGWSFNSFIKDRVLSSLEALKNEVIEEIEAI